MFSALQCYDRQEKQQPGSVVGTASNLWICGYHHEATPRGSAVFPSKQIFQFWEGRIHQKLTPALSPQGHRDSYVTGSTQEVAIIENFGSTGNHYKKFLLTGRNQDSRESLKYGLNLASKEMKHFHFHSILW